MDFIYSFRRKAGEGEEGGNFIKSPPGFNTTKLLPQWLPDYVAATIANSNTSNTTAITTVLSSDNGGIGIGTVDDSIGIGCKSIGIVSSGIGTSGDNIGIGGSGIGTGGDSIGIVNGDIDAVGDNSIGISDSVIGVGAGIGGPQELPASLQFDNNALTDIIVYSVMFVVAATGNLTVFITLYRNRHRKSRVNLMIMHLAVADLLVTLINFPLEVGWRVTTQWLAGNLACKMFQFLRAFGLYLSSLVLVCISLDRYFAVVHPLKVNDAQRRGKMMVCFAWTVAAVCSLPQSVIFHVDSHPEFPQFKQCVTFGFFSTQTKEAMYNLFGLAAMYFLPLAIITTVYLRILWEISQKRKDSVEPKKSKGRYGGRGGGGGGGIRRGRLICSRGGGGEGKAEDTRESNKGDGAGRRTMEGGRGHERGGRGRYVQQERGGGKLRLRRSDISSIERAKTRTLKMTVIIVLAFVWCWTPYVFIMMWYMFDRASAEQVDRRLQDVLFIMAVSNSCVNPIVYGTYTINLRAELQRCFKRRRGGGGISGASSVHHSTRRSTAKAGHSVLIRSTVGSQRSFSHCFKPTLVPPSDHSHQVVTQEKPHPANPAQQQRKGSAGVLIQPSLDPPSDPNCSVDSNPLQKNLNPLLKTSNPLHGYRSPLDEKLDPLRFYSDPLLTPMNDPDPGDNCSDVMTSHSIAHGSEVKAGVNIVVKNGTI